MTAEGTVRIPKQERREPSFMEEPKLFIDDDADQDTSIALGDIYDDMRHAPLRRLAELQGFACSPSAAPEDSIWRKLTERGDGSYVGFYWFDGGTRNAIRNDPGYHEMQAQAARGSNNAGQEIRIRSLEIFLERLGIAMAIGSMSLEHAE